jgi:hypothetical protein
MEGLLSLVPGLNEDIVGLCVYLISGAGVSDIHYMKVMIQIIGGSGTNILQINYAVGKGEIVHFPNGNFTIAGSSEVV